MQYKKAKLTKDKQKRKTNKQRHWKANKNPLKKKQISPLNIPVITRSIESVCSDLCKYDSQKLKSWNVHLWLCNWLEARACSSTLENYSVNESRAPSLSATSLSMWKVLLLFLGIKTVKIRGKKEHDKDQMIYLYPLLEKNNEKLHRAETQKPC